MKNPLLLTFFICLSICSVAQQGYSLISPFEGLSGRLRLLPPNAAKSQEFGNVPVNFSTGQLNFDVPLYEIQVDENLTIPIRLVYNNTGLKPQDVPTWVGNGWNLEVGGTIVQNINGLDDTNGLRQMGVYPQVLDYLGNKLSRLTKYYYLKDVSEGIKDTQFDLFSFNFLGKSGKFCFVGDTLVLMNKMPIKIEYDDLKRFTITDEKGYQFVFGSSLSNSGTFSDGYIHPIIDPTKISSVTWYLTKITTPNGVEVDFNYIRDANYWMSFDNTIYSIGYNLRAGHCVEDGIFVPSRTNTEIGIAQYLLDNIKWKGKTVSFELLNRNDLISKDGTKAKRLSAIVVNNEGNQEIKRIGFNHSYIGTNDRLKLESVSFIENKAPHSVVQTTSFEYYDKIGEDIPIPSLWIGENIRPANHAVDHWGYYNGAGGPNKIPIADYSTIIPTGATYFGFVDRKANNTYSKIGMLKKINYPTKGFTEIFYEPNIVTFANEAEIPFFLKRQTHETPPASGGFNLQIGGNRVSRIVDNTGGATSNERIITYEQSRLLAEPYYISTIEPGIIREGAVWPTAPCASCGMRYIISENNLYTWDGYQVEYKKVTETYGGNGANGKKVYEFSGNVYEGGPISLPPHAATVNLSWRTGNLIKEQTYEKTDSTYTLIKELNNTYNPVTLDNKRYGFKVGRTMTCYHEYNSEGWDYDYFTHVRTPIFSDYYHLQSTTTTEYSGGVALSNTVNYNYTPEVLLKSTSTTNSKNKTETTTNYYPNDYNSIHGTNISELKRKNIIGFPLKTIRNIDNKTIDGVLVKSDARGNPEEIYRYENDSLATHTHNPSKFFLPEFKQFEKRKYSSKGNPIQISRLNQVPTTYVWGYKHSYPIATVQNAVASSVEAVIGNLDTIADTYIADSIENIGTRLRNALPYAMVTSAVMKSGVGPSQITAPNGLKSTFDYDGMNRLSSVKDHAGNLTDYYRYYYATASEPCVTPSAPVISITSTALCSATLSATGCTGGTIQWSNGATGTSISVSSATSTSYSAKCAIGMCESLSSNTLTVPVLPTGWSTMNVGTPASPGCTQKTSGNLTMLGYGSIVDTTDNFHWAYKAFNGDVTIIAKITAIPSDSGSRSGIMIRKNLNADAQYYALIQDGNAHVGELKRDDQGSTGDLYSFAGSALNQTWIKVVKNGNTIKGYYSTNINPEANNAWNGYFSLTEDNPTTLDFGNNFYIGFALWGNANQTTFTNITINGVAF